MLLGAVVKLTSLQPLILKTSCKKKSNTVKHVFLIFSILLFSTQVNAQLKADAGNDIVLCFSDLSTSTAQLGGFPVASGGVEPYKYTWSGKILQNFGPKDSTWVYASYFLDDTTKNHPIFKRGKIAFEWPVFSLKVEDAIGKVQYDSVKIIDGSILSGGGYMLPITIHRGDSVRFFGKHYIFDSNFPIEYSLVPTSGLTDPTDLYGWAKPDTSTTYYLQLVNSAGCISKIEYWRVNVDTTTASANEVANPSIQCYLTHGDLMIHLPQDKNSPYLLTISTANGTIVHAGKYTNRDLRLSNLNLLEKQLYVVSITDRKEKKVFKLIGN